jgi:hypothetical protein
VIPCIEKFAHPFSIKSLLQEKKEEGRRGG